MYRVKNDRERFGSRYVFTPAATRGITGARDVCPRKMGAGAVRRRVVLLARATVVVLRVRVDVGSYRVTRRARAPQQTGFRKTTLENRSRVIDDWFFVPAAVSVDFPNARHSCNETIERAHTVYTSPSDDNNFPGWRKSHGQNTRVVSVVTFRSSPDKDDDG